MGFAKTERGDWMDVVVLYVGSVEALSLSQIWRECELLGHIKSQRGRVNNATIDQAPEPSQRQFV
jgi:hypothetical protein